MFVVEIKKMEGEESEILDTITIEDTGINEEDGHSHNFLVTSQATNISWEIDGILYGNYFYILYHALKNRPEAETDLPEYIKKYREVLVAARNQVQEFPAWKRRKSV